MIKKGYEYFGVYCGRYNLNSKTAKKNCSSDSECMWKNYTDSEGRETEWCTQNS
jgi:hypothetical protein